MEYHVKSLQMTNQSAFELIRKGGWEELEIWGRLPYRASTLKIHERRPGRGFGVDLL